MRRCGVRAAQDLVAAVQRQASHTRRRGRSHPGTGPGREVVAQAASARRQITVRDVGTATVFDEAPRQAILQTGSRAAHSVPLITVKGHVLGMVSSHHGHPLHGFSRLQLAALQQTGTDVGRWLSWHWDTVVLDALERLHVQAVGACR
ncbi:GAF domain-containing protein [Streptomyces anthocyanicus]|uniref:GAF domain-containing protein n=1 Tax=Streptomyces anthocyanicus TaxID=68174 RepID=UPI003253BD60